MDRRRFLPTYHYEDNTDGVLQNSIGKPLRDYKIYGNSKQSGTPAPEAPVEIESVGDEMDNLFDYSKIASKTIEGITFTNNEDGSFTANGTLTFTLSCLSLTSGIDKNAFVIGETYYLDCGAELNTDTRRYYMFLQIVNSATGTVRYFSSNGNLKTFTLAENEYISIFDFRIHSPTGEFYTVENVVFKPIICKASEYKGFEPYGYKVPIKVTGKNLFEGFDVAYCPGSTYSISGNSVTFNPGSKTAYYSYISCYMNNVELGYTYTISCDIDFDTTSDAKPMLRIGYHRADGTFVYLKNKTTATVGRHNLTFTLPAVMPEDIETSGRFVVLYNYTNVNATSISDLTLSNFQLEEGETETEYEPFKDSGTTNIYLAEPLRKAGDVADYIDFSNKCVVRKLDKMVFDGTENWRATTEIVYLDLPKTASGEYKYNNTQDCISTHLKNAYTSLTGELYFRPVGSVLRIYRRGEAYTDIEGWKAFLAEEYAKGTPVQLIIQYTDTGIETEPIELPTIPTAKGIVNIIVDTDVQPSGAVWQYYRK